MKNGLCGCIATRPAVEPYEKKLTRAFGPLEKWRQLTTDELIELVNVGDELDFDNPAFREAKRTLRPFRASSLIESFQDSGMENLVALGACKDGNIEALWGLHEKEETSDLLNVRNKSGQCCAHVAAIEGNVDVLMALEEMGRSNLFTAEDKENMTPSHYAVIHGTLNCLRYFGKKGVPLETKDKYGRAPLHIAAQEGQVDMIPVFRELGVDFKLRTHRGKTAGHYAAKFGRYDFIRALIEMELKLDVMDNDARGLVHEAAKHNHPFIIQLLVENGLICTSKDNDQNTPAHWAATGGHLEAIRMLHQVGGIQCLCLPNKTGKTPLHAAAQSGFAEIIAAFQEFGIESKVYDVGRNSPAHLAAQNGHLSALKILFEMGPVDEKNKYGRTPAHMAAWRNKPEVLGFLAVSGVDVLTCEDNEGNLPIDLAKEESSYNDSVKTLEWIERKLNTNVNTPKNEEVGKQADSNIAVNGGVPEGGGP